LFLDVAAALVGDGALRHGQLLIKSPQILENYAILGVATIRGGITEVVLDEIVAKHGSRPLHRIKAGKLELVFQQ